MPALAQPRRRLLAAILVVAALLPACHRREAPEFALKRTRAEFLRGQIAGLRPVIAQAEKGELVTSDLIAIGISEELVSTLFGASLPREIVVGGHVGVRLESAMPVFRGNKAGLLFRATVKSTDAPDASATIEMGGSLENFKLAGGILAGTVKLAHFSVVETSLGDLAADALDNLVKANASAIEAAIPPLQVPVQLEESIKIKGLTEGAVVASPGTLPLAIAVRHVIPVNGRLWVLLQAKAGPWQPDAPQPPRPETTAVAR
jgi:hypothetical protein